MIGLVEPAHAARRQGGGGVDQRRIALGHRRRNFGAGENHRRRAPRPLRLRLTNENLSRLGDPPRLDQGDAVPDRRKVGLRRRQQPPAFGVQTARIDPGGVGARRRHHRHPTAAGQFPGQQVGHRIDDVKDRRQVVGFQGLDPVVRGVAGDRHRRRPGPRQFPDSQTQGGQRAFAAAQDAGGAVGNLRHRAHHHRDVLLIGFRLGGGDQLRQKIDRGQGPHAAQNSQHFASPQGFSFPHPGAEPGGGSNAKGKSVMRFRNNDYNTAS